MGTRVIPASEFQATCLELLDEVAATGDEILITSNGRFVARLSAIVPPVPVDLSDSIVYEGDIVSPMGIVWEAER